MRLSDRATDELEVLCSMYPDALITENNTNNNKGEYFVSALVSLNISENVPPLEIELVMCERYLDDVDSAPLQIKKIKFTKSSDTNRKIQLAKCDMSKIKALECQLLQEVNCLVMEFVGQEVIFDVFNQLQGLIDDVPDFENLFQKPRNTGKSDKEDFETPTKNENSFQTQFCLIKWHHMLPGRQHAKEANVWDALEASLFYEFVVVCLGKPSMAIIEFVDNQNGDNDLELKHFLSQCGKCGKKPLIIIKESLDDVKKSLGFTEPTLNPNSSSKPKYIQPIGTTKKNEKSDLGTFRKMLRQRYGEKWANQLVNQIIEA